MSSATAMMRVRDQRAARRRRPVSPPPPPQPARAEEPTAPQPAPEPRPRPQPMQVLEMGRFGSPHTFTASETGTQCRRCWGWYDDWRHTAQDTP